MVNIMKKLMLLMVMTVILICGTGLAEETKSKPQEVCPVMGGKIDKNIYIDFQAQRIYICCPGCKDIFGIAIHILFQ